MANACKISHQQVRNFEKVTGQGLAELDSSCWTRHNVAKSPTSPIRYVLSRLLLISSPSGLNCYSRLTHWQPRLNKQFIGL